MGLNDREGIDKDFQISPCGTYLISRTGTFTVKDCRTEQRARWGRIRWEEKSGKKGERGERTDGSEMEGAEQNEKRRQGYPVAEQCHGLGPVNTQDSNAFHQVVNEHVRSKSISVGERTTSSTKQPTMGLWPWARTCRMWPRRGGPGMLCYPSLG